MSASRWRFVLPVLAASFAICGCAAHVGPVPVAEMDARGVSLARAQHLVRGDSAGLVERVLGEPADRRPSCVPGEFVWRYPIRAWNDMANRGEIVPAAVLRASFDDGGLLKEWTFADASTGRQLPVRRARTKRSIGSSRFPVRPLRSRLASSWKKDSCPAVQPGRKRSRSSVSGIQTSFAATEGLLPC
jgi:hypothetical protein